jgi:tetratricopeptide (TPR) repeat protein
MVRGRAGIVEGEDAEASQQKLSASVQQFVTDAEERAWVEPALRQLLGLEPPGDQDQERLFAAWRTFFERIAEQGVVVLVFEDLQWADSGLLDFIEHLLDWSRDRPIYLISLARPEILDRRPNWGAGRRNFASLILEPLNDDEMRELMAGLVPGLPEQVVNHVLQRAEGIPLYAVETVRMLVAEGLVTAEDGVFRPVGDLSQLSVPPSLQALIASRLDALEAADRGLLQAASVIGKTFSVEALAAVSGESSDDVARRLRGLVRRELLTLEADPRSPERGQYSFVQSVIREVAYGTLARRDRRRLHIAAARYFEALTDEGIAGALAEHYVAAYRAQPEGPEGQAVAAQARVALRAAADRASSLGAFAQAMRFLEQALEVTTDPQEERVLRTGAAEAGISAGVLDAMAHATRALELAREAGDRLAVMSGLALVARTLWQQGRMAEAVGILEPAHEEYADLAATAEFIRLAAGLAVGYMLTGRSEDALQITEANLPTAERLRLTRETLELVVTRGTVLTHLGRPLESIAVLQGALVVTQSYGIPALEIRVRINLSYAAANEEPQLGYTVARQGWELVKQRGMRGFFFMLGNAVEGAMRVGDWDWALSELEEAVATLESDIPAKLNRARILGLRGPDMSAEIDELVKQPGAGSADQWLAGVDDVRALNAFAHGDQARALDYARSSYLRVPAPDATPSCTALRAGAWLGDPGAVTDAMDILNTYTGRVTDAVRAEGQASLAALAGHRAEAAAGFREAVRQWREAGLEFEVALCELNFVRLVGGREADAAAGDAREIFLRLGAEPFLDRLEEAAASAPKATARSDRPTEQALERPSTARTTSAGD